MVGERRSPATRCGGLRASASTLNSSPISAGDSSFCTAAAALMYAADSGAPTAASASRIPQPMQERRLGGEARHLEARALAGLRHRREIDVRGDVGEARPRERIFVRAMPVMAHQRPALRCG